MEVKRITAEKIKKMIHNRRRWLIMFYDAVILLVVSVFILGVYPSSNTHLTFSAFAVHFLCMMLCVFICRNLSHVYKQVWRYGGSSAYIRLIMSDTVAGIVYYVLQAILPVRHIEFIRAFSLAATNLLLSMSMRLLYQHLYEYVKRKPKLKGVIWRLISLLSDSSISPDAVQPMPVNKEIRIKIAIVGAGNVGALLAEELIKNPQASYLPCCFIDIDRYKIGREIMGIPVLSSDEATYGKLAELGIQEIVFALPQMDPSRKKELYEHYKQTGCKIKVYDYPVMQTAENGRRHMREFDIEELLFRQPIDIHDNKTSLYYKDKVVLITGGGGSIGSELCRQIAKMQPKCLVILDVYENGAYEIQQELRMAYGKKLNLHVEIVSICDRTGLEKVFSNYHPDILLHAAAHKHVPLMEHNCCEAVKNNIFGTWNTVELAVKYKVGRFIMVSTDKAVNPTNVMGATKRMCEMIVQSHSSIDSSTIFSATRFGNVLGSAGSVIPLFKKQIRNGGPITVTDKKIIRYFMTIPEASQLVLQSGPMAKNGELFVLDMGKPVRILELAENMIRLSGFEPYKDIDIIETGLRPGEKLYEELMIQTETLDKTENSMIFIERDKPLPMEMIKEKLAALRFALATEDEEVVKNALKKVVPTFRNPEEVNRVAAEADEMKMVLDYDITSVQSNVIVG